MTIEQSIQNHVNLAHAGLFGMILSEPSVRTAVDKALAAGVPFLQIIMALLPFVLQILAGKPFDLQAIIAAILALFNPPAPTH